jgi:dTDP-4-dehydrorhamnose reductase
MRILLTGKTGQFGQTFLSNIHGHEIYAPSRSEFDLETENGIATLFNFCNPEVVINAAAWTDVNAAEENEPRVFKVNATFVERLARESSKNDAKLIQISSDYVFDGIAKVPYSANSPKDPQTVYGKSKSVGEDLLAKTYPDNSFVIRTSWLYSKYRKNFVKTILRKLLENDDPIHVVQDQFGTPTWAGDLVDAAVFFAENEIDPGIYHFTNVGETSWFQFAVAIAILGGFDPNRIKGMASSEMLNQVNRPKYSVLSLSKTEEILDRIIPTWEQSLEKSLGDIISNVEIEI